MTDYAVLALTYRTTDDSSHTTSWISLTYRYMNDRNYTVIWIQRDYMQTNALFERRIWSPSYTTNQLFHNS